MGTACRPFLAALLAAALAALAAGSPARAESDAKDCGWPAYDAARPLSVAKVVGPARVHFIRSANAQAACPSPAAGCVEPSYLVPGDLVLAGRTEGSFVCVYYLAPKARAEDFTMDWIRGSSLSPIGPAPAERSSDWTGTWIHPGGQIDISSAGALLAIHGEQVYPAGPTGEDVRNGVIDAKVKPQSRIAFSDSDGECLVRMTRAGSWLAVEDNGACGGEGVTFLGLYRRK